ncbi:hypothetical protein CYLTODRAFT_65671 [Cylindrobasidium torrendii FP15055 ss-10]|uniref:Uncharacterized protein n=1 Tax=Cylindrobasidium torrendii FP15055 ss-10 TaxID=1314674 RepID=A0A0D7B4B6_9AGAR|nr:hypothetical protein CYLTODRAFT_65671 [Cylindrobasidium torrendii FP15055 ss-10]
MSSSTNAYKSQQVRALDTPVCPEYAGCDFTSTDEDVMKAHIQNHKTHSFVCEYGCTQRNANSDESIQRIFKDAHLQASLVVDSKAVLCESACTREIT